VDGHVNVMMSVCEESVDECLARLNAAAEQPARRNQLPATELRLFAIRSLLSEQFVSVAELTAQDGYTFHHKPSEIARTLLSSEGAPVVCLNAPEGTADRNVAALTFYGLAETPHIVGTLLREQERVLAQLHPAITLDYKELRRQLRRLRGGHNVPVAAILTAACGSEEAAARLLHAKLSVISTAVAGACAAAEAEARRYATLLMIECLREGVTDPTQATRLIKDRARHTLNAEHAHAANSPDVHDLQGTPEDTLFAQAVRDGIQFVMTSEAVRFSEFQTVRAGKGEYAEFRPRINLLQSISTIYSAYAKKFGCAALSESTFRRRCILPEMKPEGSRTCLCCHCEALLEAINALVALLRAPVLRSFVEAPRASAAHAAAAAAAAAAAREPVDPPTAATAPHAPPVDGDELLQREVPAEPADFDVAACHVERLALLKRALALRRAFFDYGEEVRALVSADRLSSFTDEGKLSWADLPEVAGLSGLVDSAAALVTLADGDEEPAIAEWLASLLPLAGELDKATEHVARRTWQNVRYEQHLDLLSEHRSVNGKRAIFLVFDFKEKVAAEMLMRQRQGDYWKNSVVSVLGVTVYWDDNGARQSHYIDLVSDDTSQDSVWMDAALPVIAATLLKMFPSGISDVCAWSDNGCHFHNSSIFAEALPAFAKVLGSTLCWNFFEAGEGKGPCDQHFAVMAHIFVDIVRSRGALRGVEQIQEAICAMANTTALLLSVPRASEPSRGWSYTGIAAYKQFMLQVVAEDAARDVRMATQWHVRTVCGLGAARALSAGSWSARWVKLTDAKTRLLLTRALQRRAGSDRQAALVALSNSEPLLADSKCFGAPLQERGEARVDTPAYLNALCALKFVLEKEYTSGERDAAAVGGQQKPHTIAQAIVQLEHCRDVAQMRSEAAAGAQGSNTEAPATLLAAGAAPLPASAVVTAASPAPTPISTAAVAASVLQARIAAAIREEQVAAAKAATKRKELTALRSELSMFATQAAGSNAQPLGRRVHAPRAGAVRPPDLAEHI